MAEGLMPMDIPVLSGDIFPLGSHSHVTPPINQMDNVSLEEYIQEIKAFTGHGVLNGEGTAGMGHVCSGSPEMDEAFLIGFSRFRRCWKYTKLAGAQENESHESELSEHHIQLRQRNCVSACLKRLPRSCIVLRSYRSQRL
ncbi:hypothetical protein J437_LFUL002134, partial [Ladona fulva]